MNTPRSEHQQWDERLQDWLEGTLPAQEQSLLQAHMEHCSQCRDHLQMWQQLDEQLQAALPPLSLDAQFDACVFAQIAATDELERSQLRSRLEHEHAQQRQALLQRWRRSLALMVPGIFGGLALALSLASWMDDSGATGALAQSAVALSQGHAPWAGSALTAILGAAIGAVLAPWLARLAD